MLTRAVRRGDRYILNGEKMWITNGSIADVAVIWAKTTKTTTCAASWSKRARPASKPGTSTANCRCAPRSPPAWRSPIAKFPPKICCPASHGLRGPLSCLTQARYGIGWGAIGAAMACYQTALDYAKTRRQFQNKPIASHQLVQDKLVWMITEISKAQLLALHIGRLKDPGRADPAHISMLKMNNVWMALETARKARDILGANGIVDDYCIMRHMNNLESVSTYEGTHDIHRLVIGEHITGIPAYRLGPAFSGTQTQPPPRESLCHRLRLVYHESLCGGGSPAAGPVHRRQEDHGSSVGFGTLARCRALRPSLRAPHHGPWRSPQVRRSRG